MSEREQIMKVIEEAFRDGQSQYLHADGGLSWEDKRGVYDEALETAIPTAAAAPQDALRDVRALLQAIYDLIDDEDAAEPLDYAIEHAKKAIVILDVYTHSRPFDSTTDAAAPVREALELAKNIIFGSQFVATRERNYAKASEYQSYIDTIDASLALSFDSTTEAVRKALFEPDTSDAIDNLEGALIDIKRFHEQGKPTDQVCINTLERIMKQLIAVHTLVSRPEGK